jgi:sugar lactone lactonase YvrE
MLLLISILGGCATEKAVSKKRYVWPRPPDEPKIEWVKSYYSQHSFPKTGVESFLETIIGEAPAITFMKPIDIKSNGKGRVFIADIDRNAIIVYDLVNSTVTEWKSADSSRNIGDFTPFYITIDSKDNVYAVGKGLDQIVVLDANGRFVRKIDYTGKISSPGGIALNEALGRLYLVDSAGSKIVVYTQAGEYLLSYGKPGEKDGEFNRPSAITVNSKNEVIVGDTHNARIQIFDQDIKYLRKFGVRGDGGENFQVIKGVAVDSDDNIYVTDGKANQIKIFSAKGEYLLAFGAAHSVPITGREAPGGFLLPQGIHIDSTDTIFIADQANMRFQMLKYLKGAPSGTGKPASQAGKDNMSGGINK